MNSKYYTNIKQKSNSITSRFDHIYASVVGRRLEKDNIIHVNRHKEASAIPDIGNVVTGRVLRINPRFATLSIMVVDATPCHENFQGIIRVQDVRSTEKDKVQIYQSFRPNDIVRCEYCSFHFFLKPI
jgi:exosome complex component CSL4